MSGRGHLFSASPVRLALGLVALFALVSVASLVASYTLTSRALDTQMRQQLRQDLAGFRAAPTAAALAALVAAEAQATDPDRVVLSYVTENGRHFGNGRLERDQEGYVLTTLEDTGTPISGEYLALATREHRGLLTVARSRSEIDQLWAVYRTIALLSLLPTLIIALGAGLAMARRSARQVDAVRRTLGILTSGDLSARVRPTSAWSDDLRRVGNGIDRMAAAYENSTAALRQVSSDVAHDLKTPIQRISVRLDELGRTDLDPDAQALVDQARADIAGVVSVFRALLQIAQIEAGTPKSRFQPVDLAALVDTFAELYEPAAQESGRQLRTDVPERPMMVHGDADLIGQILANLIENALRHTPHGSDIALRLERLPDRAILHVSDNGPGIPASERDKVMQRLYRLDRSRNTPGSGLGLSLVSVIANLHDAGITLSDNDPGLCVSISFQALSA
ncbi:HAMP domain-containing sensor histidine kinase [Loktanella sp. SALINAS62]|uniref:sensor histidine kinase n=1 Tax=Loktanella sp. SALINAS62 TaxID=2706124 RepID=UPI001B8C2FD5|nr:HAMP domain-containing sensor histidine kinase [Loktanella sp. SALINAS62]MBS1303852.1 HAMP domain-containing histidine kinase [Loktanella sp. SALINAS62]